MMNDIEMDLYITQVEARILKKTVREQEDQIANLKNHVKALQVTIERQRKCIDHLLEVGDPHG